MPQDTKVWNVQPKQRSGEKLTYGNVINVLTCCSKGHSDFLYVDKLWTKVRAEGFTARFGRNICEFQKISN